MFGNCLITVGLWATKNEKMDEAIKKGKVEKYTQYSVTKQHWRVCDKCNRVKALPRIALA